MAAWFEIGTRISTFRITLATKLYDLCSTGHIAGEYMADNMALECCSGIFSTLHP